MADINSFPKNLQEAVSKDPSLMAAFAKAPIIGASKPVQTDDKHKKITFTITADTEVYDDLMTAVAYLILCTSKANPKRLALEMTCPENYENLDFIVESDEKSLEELDAHVESLVNDFTNYNEEINPPVVAADDTVLPAVDAVDLSGVIDAINFNHSVDAVDATNAIDAVDTNGAVDAINFGDMLDAVNLNTAAGEDPSDEIVEDLPEGV